MEITEQWIAKAAGWKANKAGRELFRQGAVLNSTTNNNNVVTGSLRSGAKPTRVTVKVHSATDVDTVCPRLVCRRNGEICEHAVALMLHSISDPPERIEPASNRTQTSPSKPAIVSKPLEVILPPNFPESLNRGQGGLSIRTVEIDAEATNADQQLSQWLSAATGKSAPSMMGLRGTHALTFLRALTDHPRVTMNEQAVAISSRGTRIPMTLHRDDDRLEISLCESIAQHGLSWYADDTLYLWDSEQRCLLIHNVSALWKPRYWQRLADGNMVSIPIKEYLTGMDMVEDLVIWDDASELGNIPISVAEPSFVLQIDGSTQLLKAKLKAVYAPGEQLTIGILNPASNEVTFPLSHPTERNHYLTRNREAEDEAAGILMQAGFQIIDSQGAWQLSDDDEIIDFLTATLPNLTDWKIITSNKLQSIKSNIVRVTPNFDFQANAPMKGSGQDWLAFDLSFQTDGGKEIPKEVIQRMLSTGKRSGTSKNGKQVIISNFDADTIEVALRDLNPKQEHGLYYAPKMQAAYLRRLQQHYTNRSTQTEPDLSITEKLPAEILQTLRPYQTEGIAWLHDRVTQEGAALLADDMGLGKTLQTLSLLHLLESDKPHLVVCPTSLLGNWQNEINKFFPDFEVLVLHGDKRKEKFATAHNADIIITSYALVTRDIEVYQNTELGALVIDEASIIRNPDTQAAKSLRKIKAQHRLALTGTPVENAVRDLWSLYEFLLPGYLGSRKDFQNHYEKPLSGNLPDHHTMRRLRMRTEPFMLRRTKSKVAKDLPPKMEQVIFCEPTKTQQTAYTKILRQGTAELASIEGSSSQMQMLTLLLRLRQASCDLRLLDQDMDINAEDASAKITRLTELLLEAKAGGHRVLVFSQFTTMLALIKTALTESDISYSYLDGSTKDRAKEVEKFQSPTGPDVFLISLKAGGYGLNLTAADTVIHFDPWWNPAVEAQATDRAHRIGQTKPINVYKLVAKGTVEEKIIQLQKSKQGLISAALSDEHSPIMQGLSQSEISSLLRS